MVQRGCRHADLPPVIGPGSVFRVVMGIDVFCVDFYCGEKYSSLAIIAK